MHLLRDTISLLVKVMAGALRVPSISQYVMVHVNTLSLTCCIVTVFEQEQQNVELQFVGVGMPQKDKGEEVSSYILFGGSEGAKCHF